VETTAGNVTGTELVRRAEALVPVLRLNAEWNERHRRLHGESIDAMAEAGLFRMRVPTRFGGYESDTRTIVDVVEQLARGDGATAWTAAVWWITTWMVGLFPDPVQEEVFGTADVRVCGTLSPSASATPASGGVTVNGRWGFISGAPHSQWQVLVAMSVTPDGQPAPILALAPMRELEIVDDWYTGGLRGSGSVSTVATELFVPEERVLPLGPVLHEQYASEKNRDAASYRSPLIPTASVTSVGTVLGLAAAAREVFFDRLPTKKITYTSYGSQLEAPLTHLQVAEAAMKTDEARVHAHRLASLVDTKGVDGTPWTVEDRALARVRMGRACQLAAQAVDILAGAGGGSSIYESLPIQRISRDVRAICLHALMHPDTNLELYGRVLCGLEPNTFYL
jgi:alkylation response protein AidB-like acyl-CoA dehydrogenase